MCLLLMFGMDMICDLAQIIVERAAGIDYQEVEPLRLSPSAWGSVDNGLCCSLPPVLFVLWSVLLWVLLDHGLTPLFHHSGLEK